MQTNAWVWAGRSHGAGGDGAVSSQRTNDVRPEPSGVVTELRASHVKNGHVSSALLQRPSLRADPTRLLGGELLPERGSELLFALSPGVSWTPREKASLGPTEAGEAALDTNAGRRGCLFLQHRGCSGKLPSPHKKHR